MSRVGSFDFCFEGEWYGLRFLSDGCLKYGLMVKEFKQEIMDVFSVPNGGCLRIINQKNGLDYLNDFYTIYNNSRVIVKIVPCNSLKNKKIYFKNIKTNHIINIVNKKINKVIYSKKTNNFENICNPCTFMDEQTNKICQLLLNVGDLNGIII